MKQEKLFDLLKAAVSPCECVKAAKQELLENGFEEIDYTGDWKLVRGGRYVLNHHDTTMFAFTVGSGYNKKDMVRIAAAHTDYPYLRIKPNPDFMTNSYAQVNVEVYGGPILNTWFDRPLGVAGRVAIKSEDVFNPRMVLYRSKKPVMIIPNLAIHMNRDVNKGVGINNQVDLMPVLDSITEDEMTTDYFLSFLARELSVEKSDIIDFELNTFCMEEPCFVGVNDTMISSPRIDNQSSCRALLDAIEDGNRADGINIIALFDHEEIGSSSKQGAASIMLHDMLRRILRNMDLSENEIDEMRMKAVVPFQLAYAVSIHKAQGLEYDSVKIVIPDSISERVTHGVFYTAITRAKKKLKIYWSAETMTSVIEKFSKEELGTRSLDIIKKKLN